MPIRQAVIASMMLLNLSSVPFAAGLASSGGEIALKWCASCHVVADDQPSALVDAPTFAHIAKTYENDIAVLELFLADPHPVMPNMSLTRQEILDLLAYIGSLN